jgi:hypothetical protein
MKKSGLPSIVGSALSDVLQALEFGASNLGGTLLGTTLGALLGKRLEVPSVRGHDRVS